MADLMNDLETFMSDMDKDLDLPEPKMRRKKSSGDGSVMTRSRRKKKEIDTDDDMSTMTKTKKSKKKYKSYSTDDDEVSAAESTMTKSRKKKKSKETGQKLDDDVSTMTKSRRKKKTSLVDTDDDDVSIAESAMTKTRKKKKKKENVSTTDEEDDNFMIPLNGSSRRRKKKKSSKHFGESTTDDDASVAESTTSTMTKSHKKKKKKKVYASTTDDDEEASVAESSMARSKKKKKKAVYSTDDEDYGDVYSISAKSRKKKERYRYDEEEGDYSAVAKFRKETKPFDDDDTSIASFIIPKTRKKINQPYDTDASNPSLHSSRGTADRMSDMSMSQDMESSFQTTGSRAKRLTDETDPIPENWAVEAFPSSKPHEEVDTPQVGNGYRSLPFQQTQTNDYPRPSYGSEARAIPKAHMEDIIRRLNNPTNSTSPPADVNKTVDDFPMKHGAAPVEYNRSLEPTADPAEDVNERPQSLDADTDDNVSLVSEARSMLSKRQQGMVKLDLGRAQLYGREQEKLAIRNAIDRVSRKDAPSEVMMILGNSGTGKTSLVLDCLRECKKPNFFAVGKFDQNDSNNKPYAAFADAVAELCGQIVDHDLEQMICDGIRDTLGDEFFRLTCLVPDLGTMIESESMYDGDHEQFCSDLNSFKRLLYLFRKMLRIIGQTNTPVILFLDDIQWAEFDSLALFQYLASDDLMKNVLLIGSYQDYAIDRDHPLSVMLEEIEDNKLTLLRLDNLEEDQVNVMLSDLMQTEPSLTEPLSRIVHKRTKGNCFYVKQFLELVQEHDYLRYSFKSKHWEWNLHKIKTETKPVGNVVDCIVARTQNLPENPRVVLRTAACFGTTFEVRFVAGILGRGIEGENASNIQGRERAESMEAEESSKIGEPKCFNVTVFEDTNIQNTVDGLTELGFLRKMDRTLYRFVHDTVQEAAYALVPPGNERDELHWNIGNLLKDHVQAHPELEDSVTFAAAVDQLNRGSMCMTNEKESIELATLNLKAGMKAKEKLAFFLAADYAKAGIMFLERGLRWSLYRDLTMELCLLAAETALCCDDESECMHVTTEIILNASSVIEQIPAYMIRMRMLGQRGRYAMAMKEGLKALESLGEKFPRTANPSMMIGSLLKTNKRDVREMSGHDLLNLPRMSDDMKLCAMRILALTVFFAVRAPDEPTKLFVPLLYYRMFILSLTSGLCSESVLAFGGYAVVVGTMLGDHVEAFRFGNLAQQLQHKLNATKYMARATILEFGYTQHLKMPVRISLDPLKEAFKVAMAHGGNEDAMLSASFYCIHWLYAGMPLGPLARQLHDFLELMREYTKDTTYRKMAPVAQFIDNLMGRSAEPLVLIGDVMNEQEMMQELNTGENPSALRPMFIARCELAYWFREFGVADHFLLELQKLKEDLGAKSSLAYRREVFVEGLTHLAVARSARKAQHLRSARKCTKVLEHYVEIGAVDCIDMLRILEAETMSLKRLTDSETVLEAYEVAIKAAEKAGSLQNIGLANELAGMYLMRIGDCETAQSLLMQAHDVYIDWNAYGKVNHMAEMHPQLSGVD